MFDDLFVEEFDLLVCIGGYLFEEFDYQLMWIELCWMGYLQWMFIVLSWCLWENVGLFEVDIN